MPFPTGWARKCALTINSAQIVGSGTHNSFPVLLTQANLPSDMLDKDGAAPARMGGGDIRFTSDAAGTTKLPCHVVEFITANNPANARATIYVALNLPTGSSTTIYVWYRTATEIDQPKYNANPDADGFQGSDYVWANYDIVLPLGGFGGLRNLKQANATKNVGRYGPFNARTITVAARASGNTYISFPSMVRVGDRLYCAAREATTHNVSVSGQVTVRYSDDFGQTWTEDAGLASTDASFDLRDPQLLAQSNGTLWLFYTKTNAADTTRVVYYRKATAPYSSWGSESVLTTQTRANNGSKPIELASGRIVVPCYDVPTTTSAPFVRWSDDSGATWTTDFLTADGNAPGSYGNDNEFSVAESPTSPGTLIVIIRRNGASNLYRQVSTDSGQTWTTAASNIALDVASPDMPEIQYCRDGDLLLAYAKDRLSPKYYVARSTDDGATWQSDAAILWDSAGAAGEPGGLTGYGGYVSFVEVSKGLFSAVYFHDQDLVSRVFATHFSKVEDGQLNSWTDTSWVAATGQAVPGVEFSDAELASGSPSLSYWNNVHNGGAFTISGWAKFNQISDEGFAFFGSTAFSQDRGWFFAYENRAAASAPNALRLFKADGAGVIVENTTASISGDTNPHRYGVFCSAGGVPTFIKDTTTYAGTNAITATAGDSELPMRIGGASFTGSGGVDVPALRMDGWMGMWTLAPSNLGADYEKTRYNTENAPATFLTAAAPTGTGFEASVAATGTVTYTGAAAVVATIVSASDLTAAVAAIGSVTYTGTAAVVASVIDTPTSTEPVTIAEAKAAARISDTSAFDDMIPGLITAARQLAEQETGRELVRKTRRSAFSDWPAADLVLPVYAAESVVISYWGASGWTSLDGAAFAFYELGTGTGIAPAVGTSWPALSTVAGGPRVRVDVTAGPADPTSADACVKLYIKALVAWWIDNPSAVVAGSLQPAPFLRNLLDPARLWA